MPLVSQLCIYPKNVAVLLGLSYEGGKKRLQRLRTAIGKTSREMISVSEFCAATGLLEHEVRAALRAG